MKQISKPARKFLWKSVLFIGFWVLFILAISFALSSPAKAAGILVSIIAVGYFAVLAEIIVEMFTE